MCAAWKPPRAHQIGGFVDTLRTYTRSMSKTTLRIPPEFDEASTADRIAFVTQLWDQILESGAVVPIPDHHRAILDERLRAFRVNPEPGKPWAEVRDELLARLRSL